MNKKKKILFGAVDVGYRIELYSKFIKENYANKLEVDSFSKYVLPESHYKTSYTYTCEIYKKSKLYVYSYLVCFFIYALFKYDIFHFLSGETILTRKLRRFELRVYKLFGKKIIMHFVGADIRSNKYIKWKNDHIEDYLKGRTENLPPISEEWQKKLVADAIKYANSILVSTPDLLKIIPHAKFYPVVIDFEKFLLELGNVKKTTSEETHIILHSPSNESIKGTKFIYSTLENIKKIHGNKVQLLLPGKGMFNRYYSTTRYELMELYKESTILIDQLTIGWYGLQSVEALLTGNYVFCYIESDLEKYLFPHTPISNVNAKNLEFTLTSVIDYKQMPKTDEDKMRDIEWVKKYHTIDNNNKILLEAWGMK